MAINSNELAIIVYAPALRSDEERALTIVHGMERTYPGLRLEWTTSEEENLIALPHRDEWVKATRTNGGLPFLCNEEENRLVTVAGWENPNGLAAGSPPHFEVHADLPLDAVGIAAAADVLEAIGEGARAYWGHATPFNAGVEIAEQTINPGRRTEAPPRGLPALKLPESIPSPEIPHRLGWLNYWSADSARSIGFPDPARDAELLSRARRTPTGGWVVSLTEAPLDLDNAAHLEALKRAYERFPVIGGRVGPGSTLT